jgi:predicted lipid-binding transport protein (Tim44 family)
MTWQRPEWLTLAMAAWTLPFVWIGIGMTLRRAVDAGQSAWLCLAFFVPVGNYVLMLVLSILPTRTPGAWRRNDPAPEREARLRSAFAGAATGALAAALMLLISVFGLRRYGVGLFLGAPVILGVVAAFIFNRGHPRTERATAQLALVGVLVAGGLFVIFAIEGIVCVVMALPMTLPLAVLGGVFGRAMALLAPSPRRPRLAAADRAARACRDRNTPRPAAASRGRLGRRRRGTPRGRMAERRELQ